MCCQFLHDVLLERERLAVRSWTIYNGEKTVLTFKKKKPGSQKDNQV